MNENLTLLIVDDDVEICQLLSQFLQKHQFNVITAHDGIEMFAALEKQRVNLIVLDLMLPGDDGITLCRKLQSESIPVLMVSAAGEETDRIIGLEVGADDFIAKPFNPRELLARIRAILRRSQPVNLAPSDDAPTTTHCALTFNKWTLDLVTRQLISPDSIEIALSSGEFDLLAAFLNNPQQVLSRDKLLDMTKNRYADPFDRSIDMQVSRLRQKIEKDPKYPRYIKTIRGGGYLFTPEVAHVNAT